MEIAARHSEPRATKGKEAMNRPKTTDQRPQTTPDRISGEVEAFLRAKLEEAQKNLCDNCKCFIKVTIKEAKEVSMRT
jgi:hypothetical protein